MLLAEIQSNIDEKPNGPVGKRLARRWVNLFKEIESKNPEFKAAIPTNLADHQIPHIESVKHEIRAWIEEALAS